MRTLTHFSVFASETMDGMAKIFQAGFGLGPTAQALRSAGLAQVMGAMSAANAAAAQIRFANEMPSNAGRPSSFNNPDQYTQVVVNINRAQVNADDIVNAINSKLKNQGSSVILR